MKTKGFDNTKYFFFEKTTQLTQILATIFKSMLDQKTST